MIELVLPWPPSVNHYWRHVGPKVLISAKGREYRELVKQSVDIAGVRPIQGPLSVIIEAAPPDRRRRDLDNMLKAPLDALTHAGVWQDDSDIDALSISRLDRSDGGFIRIRIDFNEENLCPCCRRKRTTAPTA